MGTTRKDFIGAVKNTISAIFKKKAEKIKQKIEKKPEIQVAQEKSPIPFIPKKEKCSRRIVFPSQIEAKKRRKRKIRERMAKKSRRLNRAA